MNKHLPKSLRALFLSLAVLLSLPVLAVEIEIDGINYDLNADAKQATVIKKSSGKYSGEVVIPESVEFKGISHSVTSIGEYAFYNCYGLTSVTIPNSVTSIGKDAFFGCFGLTSVTIPNSVTSIESSAFQSSGLTSVTIGNSVTSIGSSAFQSSGLISVTIPNSVTSIGGNAFRYCYGLTSVTIGNSVTSIGRYAFSSCKGLTSVTIPNSVTSIGQEGFSGCSGLTSVTIGNSVTSIGENAFHWCTGLTSVVVEDGNPVYDSRNNCNAIIETATNTLHYGCKTTIIPNSVTSIGSYAFSFCSGLTSVNIPNSVTSIGRAAFSNCSGLTSVTIPNSVTSIGGYAFNACSNLQDVYCYAEKVPSTHSDAFINSPISSATLHVPAASVKSYRASAPWSSFGRIVAITSEESGIGELKGENRTENSALYDLSGRRVQKGQKGFFIQNGKVMVR